MVLLMVSPGTVHHPVWFQCSWHAYPELHDLCLQIIYNILKYHPLSPWNSFMYSNCYYFLFSLLKSLNSAKFYIFYFLKKKSCLCVWICVYVAHGDQKRVRIHWSCSYRGWNHLMCWLTQVLVRATHALHHWATSAAPNLLFLTVPSCIICETKSLTFED